MSNNILDSLNRALSYIEANLESRLNLDSITTQVYLSKFHFHRVFKKVTGKSLMDYTKARQLSKSAERLLQSSLRVSDIAADYGFEHYQSYSRAFFNEFMCTPNEFRSGSRTIKLTEPLNLDNLTLINQGLLINPQTLLLPDLTLMGTRHKILFEENFKEQTASKAGRIFYYDERPRIKSHKAEDSYFGLTRFPGDLSLGYSYYLPSIAVPPDEEVPEGMVKDFLKANKYAVFTYVGSHSPDEIYFTTLSEILGLVDTWREQKRYMNDKGYLFEHIPYELCTKEYCELEICLPL